MCPVPIADEVQRRLADTFFAMAKHAAAETGIRELLVIGGVASNQYIRRQMLAVLGKNGVAVRFAANPFSSDNAVGVAAIGQQFFR